jgi:hypothetical protein
MHTGKSASSFKKDLQNSRSRFIYVRRWAGMIMKNHKLAKRSACRAVSLLLFPRTPAFGDTWVFLDAAQVEMELFACELATAKLNDCGRHLTPRPFVSLERAPWTAIWYVSDTN